jgi:uncharacterized protein (TIGR03083 family)
VPRVPLTERWHGLNVRGMSGAITDKQWHAARDGMRDAAERFIAIVRSSDPGAAATKDWSVAVTTAHVTAIALVDTAFARPGEVAFPYPWNEVEDLIGDTSVDTVYALNDSVLDRFAERDTQVLTDQLSSHVNAMLDTSAGLDPDKTVSWLGGAQVPLAGIFAHLTNELNIHGWDIARATRSRWVTPPEQAVQFLDTFIRGMVHHGMGEVLDSSARPARSRIAVEFLSRHMRPLTLVLSEAANGGGNTVTFGEPGDRVDVRVRFEPAALNLMMFGRISQWRAGLTGKVFVSGPRPWLLPAFQRIVHFPS